LTITVNSKATEYNTQYDKRNHSRANISDIQSLEYV